jgi:hypothetical protein
MPVDPHRVAVIGDERVWVCQQQEQQDHHQRRAGFPGSKIKGKSGQ